MIVVWGMFQLGQLCRVAIKIDSTVRDLRQRSRPHRGDDTTTATSRIEIVRDRWIPLAVRSIFCTAAFWLFLAGGLVQVLSAFDITAPKALPIIAAVMTTTAGPPLAFFIGIGCDYLIGSIPKLQTYVPKD